MLKVCHMTSAHRNDDVRIFHKECISLVNAGYDVHLVAQGQSFEREGVQIIGVGEHAGSRLIRMTNIANKIYRKALSIDADIYHIHDPELLPYAKKLVRMGKRVIFDSHEDYREQIQHKYYIPIVLRNITAGLYKYYESSVIKHIDAVIVPCSFNGLNIFEGVAKKTAYINNAPILSQFYDQYEDQKSDYVQEPSICYTGVLSHSRGITHLIRAAHKANVNLILAGEFSPQNYHDDLLALPEYECVDYRGYLNRNEILDVYKQSSIGVSTILNVGQYNKGDNFATKVYEYMSMGLPVILSDSPYARSILQRYNFGICVQPDNEVEIVSAICYLSDNPTVAMEMGQNGRRAVWEKFNWNIEENKLIKLYQSLLYEPT